jgi:hypothetical protein
LDSTHAALEKLEKLFPADSGWRLPNLVEILQTIDASDLASIQPDDADFVTRSFETTYRLFHRNRIPDISGKVDPTNVLNHVRNF